MGHFFRLCLKAAFSYKVWDKAQGLAAAIICLIGLAAYLVPRLLPAVPKVDEPVILAAVFIGIIMFRLIASPYWVYKQVVTERDIFRTGLMKRGCYEEVRRVEGLVDDD